MRYFPELDLPIDHSHPMAYGEPLNIATTHGVWFYRWRSKPHHQWYGPYQTAAAAASAGLYSA